MNDAVREYAGKSITVLYDASLCERAAACVDALNAVFDPSREPWIEPDAAPVDELVKAIATCPSGALTYRLCRPGTVLSTANVVQVGADGPLRVSGEINLYDTDGELISEEVEVALCRCGASRHKPFCDRSHEREAFSDPGRVHEPRLGPPLGGAETRLDIHPRRDGPYIVKGLVRIVSADGDTVMVREKVALCRCGASANKPFCDGSHKAVEFVAD